MPKQINLFYLHSERIGYGRAGMKLADTLQRHGVTVFDHLEGSDEYNSDNSAFVPPVLDADYTGSLATDIRGTRRSGAAQIVCWFSVPSHAVGWYTGQTPIMFTMWEGTRLPESFREGLDNFDTIIVPSQHNVDLFSEYHDNVKLVPLGIDIDDWRYVEREEPGAQFRFLCGGSGKRKGGDLVVKAFDHLWGKGGWGSGPEPTLILKSPKGADDIYGPRIEVVGGYLSKADEIALYARSHCYVQPSRGEGFGLQPLQAIAQGMPTILTRDHGHGAFSHLGYSLDSTMSKAAYFIFGDAGDWWEPNFDQLCDYMAYVYENYADACGVAKEMAVDAATNFSWDRVADGFLDAVGRERLVAYTGPRTWTKQSQRQYRVVVRQEHYHEMADRAYHYEVGKEYYVPADVKRLLFEVGLLAPECVEEVDAGLAPNQLERYYEDHDRHMRCPTCNHILGEVPT